MIYEIKAYLTVLCFALSHLQMLWFLQIEGKTLHQQKDHMIFCSGLESYHAKSASTPVSPFFEMESFEPQIWTSHFSNPQKFENSLFGIFWNLYFDQLLNVNLMKFYLESIRMKTSSLSYEIPSRCAKLKRLGRLQWVTSLTYLDKFLSCWLLIISINAFFPFPTCCYAHILLSSS